MPKPGDKRFSDNAYRENAAYFYLAQQYLLLEHLVNELIDGAELNEDTAVKARFAARFILDALSPTNTLPGNPAAIRKAFDTGGSVSCVVFGTFCTISDTTEGGRRRSIGHNSRWASISAPHPDPLFTAAI